MLSKPAYSITRARLNPPFFIQSDTVFALMLKNHSSSPLHLQHITFTCKGFVEGSAVMFTGGRKITLKAAATKNKITLEGIEIPPRENVLIFYRVMSMLT